MNRLKQLGKDSVIYGIGGALANGVAFFLLPLYTRVFSPSDYGTIEMMVVIVSFLLATLVMGMDSAQSYFFFEQKKNGLQAQREVVSAILQLRLTWGISAVIAAGLSAPLLNSWFFQGSLQWHYFAIAFAGAFFATIMGQSIELFRLLYKPWSYVCITLVNSILGAGLIILFVIVFEQGVYGYFLGTTISALVVAGVGWYLMRDYIDFSVWHTAWWPRLLRFGIPLLPAGMAFYAMSTMDRWFIQHYHGSEALGIYSAGAKFALIMALIAHTFRKAWWPVAMDAMQSNDGPHTFRMIARLYTGIGTAGVIFLAVISPWLVRWMTGPEFHSAWPIVSILAWQSLFYGFYLIASAGIWKAEKTSVSMILMIGAAIINLGLNYALVPNYGGIGAAVATATTFFLWTISSMYISEKYWRVGFPFIIILSQIGVGIIVVSALLVLMLQNIYSAWMFVVVGLLSISLLISALDATQRKHLIKVLHNTWKK
jgi:O-antigen/teichoic acid export membrane protein